MSTLQERLIRATERLGPDSPAVQMLRDQIAAQVTGKSAQGLYLTGSVKGLGTDGNKSP
jgi:hypothetical protein